MPAAVAPILETLRDADPDVRVASHRGRSNAAGRVPRFRRAGCAHRSRARQRPAAAGPPRGGRGARGSAIAHPAPARPAVAQGSRTPQFARSSNTSRSCRRPIRWLPSRGRTSIGCRRILTMSSASWPRPVRPRRCRHSIGSSGPSGNASRGKPRPDRRRDWLTVRGAVHQALAARGSRVAAYDLREAIETAERALAGRFRPCGQPSSATLRCSKHWPARSCARGSRTNPAGARPLPMRRVRSSRASSSPSGMAP